MPPGLRGLIVDSVLRGTHIEKLARAGVLTVNWPHAKSNPNGNAKRLAPGRTERTKKIRSYSHERPNGTACRHTLHLVGSVISQEVTDATGTRHLQALTPSGYKDQLNADGTHRFYVVVSIPCRHGEMEALVRLDQATRDDVQHESRAELARFYPTNTVQFGLLYGRRNATESLHNKMKQRMKRLPAYGAVRQSLFMIGYMLTHNAVALAMRAKRNGQPNALDGTL